MSELENKNDINDIYIKRNTEISELRGTVKGIAVTGAVSFGLNIVLSILLSALGLTDTAFLTLCSMGILTVAAVFMPFALTGRLRRGTGSEPPNGRCKNSGGGFLNMLLLIVFGFGGCAVLNFSLSALSVFFPVLGGESAISSYGDCPELIPLMLLTVAVLPAVCEELAFRGVVTGMLKKYGDRLSIIISAVIFGLLHQSPVNIIFAFLSGLIFGYIRSCTDSLIPPIVIHFLNNAFGVSVIFLYNCLSASDYITVYYSIILISSICGAAALAAARRRGAGLFGTSDVESALTLGDKLRISFRGLILYMGVPVVIMSVLKAVVI